MKRMLMTAALALAAVGAQAGQDKGAAMYPPRDAVRPVPLPALGRYVPDRGVIGDPVAEASRGLVGGGAVTVRPVAAAYQRQIVADPFENRLLVRPRAPVPEEAAPPLILPRK